MSRRYVTIILKLLSLAVVIAAAVCWAGARAYKRPKYSDEQTLVGGAIWSQIIIPIGMMISLSVDDHFDDTVHLYFIVFGVILLVSTGLLLVICECRVMQRAKQQPPPRVASNGVVSERHFHTRTKYDKVYFTIGILFLVAGTIKFVDFLVILFY